MFEIDADARVLELLLQFFARDHLARPLEQHRQNFKGLPVELDFYPALSELAGDKVHLEAPETHNTAV